jgi:hypothetical protein
MSDLSKKAERVSVYGFSVIEGKSRGGMIRV